MESLTFADTGITELSLALASPQSLEWLAADLRVMAQADDRESAMAALESLALVLSLLQAAAGQPDVHEYVYEF